MAGTIAQTTIDATAALIAAVKTDVGSLPDSVQINISVNAGAGRASVTIEQPIVDNTAPPVSPTTTFPWAFTVS